MGEFSRARGSPENARAQGAASARLSNGGRSREAVGACTGGVLTALLPISCEGLALHVRGYSLHSHAYWFEGYTLRYRAGGALPQHTRIPDDITRDPDHRGG